MTFPGSRLGHGLCFRFRHTEVGKMSFAEKTPLSVSKELRYALLLHRVRAGIAAQKPVVSHAPKAASGTRRRVS
jgi:hypothetical protein